MDWTSPSLLSDLDLPSTMQTMIESFNTYYQTAFNRRKLTWTSEGSVEVALTLPNASTAISLLVSPLQATILSKFLNFDSISFEKLLEICFSSSAKSTHSRSVLTAALRSLCAQRHAILVPSTSLLEDDGNFSSDTEFSFNENFSPSEQQSQRLARGQAIVLHRIAPTGAGGGGLAQKRGVDAYRLKFIDSVIMSVLKSVWATKHWGTNVKVGGFGRVEPTKPRGAISESELIRAVRARVAEQFSSQPQDIKDRVEWLLDRGYCQRIFHEMSKEVFISWDSDNAYQEKKEDAKHEALLKEEEKTEKESKSSESTTLEASPQKPPPPKLVSCFF
jgi:hypothetical protein